MVDQGAAWRSDSLEELVLANNRLEVWHVQLINQRWFRVDGWICWGDPPWWMVVDHRGDQSYQPAKFGFWYWCILGMSQSSKAKRKSSSTRYVWMGYTPAIPSKVGSGSWWDILHDPPVVGPSTNRMFAHVTSTNPIFTIGDIWVNPTPSQSVRNATPSDLKFDNFDAIYGDIPMMKLY